VPVISTHLSVAERVDIIVDFGKIIASRLYIDVARNDVIALNTDEEVRIFMRFRDLKARYVMHCHNVVHEDHAMMVRWDIV